MIEDERGHVSPEVFKKMFFTFFKGEKYAYQVYEMLHPIVSEHFLEDKMLAKNDPRCNDDNKMVVI